MTSNAPNVPSVEGAREALVGRIAEALRRSPNGVWMTLPGPTDIAPSFARAVLPLVDAEVAAAVSEAQAEVAGMKGARNAARRRAESAEAEVERVREGIRALADEWEDLARRATANAKKHPIVAGQYADEAENWTYFKDALRALLAPPPAAATGEACNCGWGGVHDPDNPRCDANRPAPVSSGEAGTGEARCVHCRLRIELGGNVPGWGLHAEGSHRGKSRCGSESGQRYGLNGHTADVPCEAPCAGIHVPAPVVTPSAEGSE